MKVLINGLWKRLNIDADTVNKKTVESNVPTDAKFTDTIYDETELSNRVTSIESQLTGLNTILTEILGE